jgi:hypothetical protein
MLIEDKIENIQDQRPKWKIHWNHGCFWNLLRVKLNWFLESKFNWGLTWIIESLRDGIKRESLKLNFTLYAKQHCFI